MEGDISAPQILSRRTLLKNAAATAALATVKPAPLLSSMLSGASGLTRVLSASGMPWEEDLVAYGLEKCGNVIFRNWEAGGRGGDNLDTTLEFDFAEGMEGVVHLLHLHPRERTALADHEKIRALMAATGPHHRCRDASVLEDDERLVDLMFSEWKRLRMQAASDPTLSGTKGCVRSWKGWPDFAYRDAVNNGVNVVPPGWWQALSEKDRFKAHITAHSATSYGLVLERFFNGDRLLDILTHNLPFGPHNQPRRVRCPLEHMQQRFGPEQGALHFQRAQGFIDFLDTLPLPMRKIGAKWKVAGPPPSVSMTRMADWLLRRPEEKPATHTAAEPQLPAALPHPTSPGFITAEI